MPKISYSDFEDKGIQIIANIIMENIFILNWHSPIITT